MRLKRYALRCGLLSLLGLSACGTTTDSAGPTSPPVVDSFCVVAKPIYWSATDTDATILAVKEHNAVWKARCEPPD